MREVGGRREVAWMTVADDGAEKATPPARVEVRHRCLKLPEAACALAQTSDCGERGTDHGYINEPYRERR